MLPCGYICVPNVSMLEILVVHALLCHVSHPRELFNAGFSTTLFCQCSFIAMRVACGQLHAVAYRLWPFCMFDLSVCWLGLGVMCMRLASFCHSQEFFHYRQRELGKKVLIDRTIVGLVMGDSSKSAPREDVNESYLTFIISQAIGCRHNLEFHWVWSSAL